MLAITMARNEADIIRATVTHLIGQGCRVVVADNLSSDGTAEELLDLPEVTLVRDEDPAYHQSTKMTELAERFAEEGEWVIPFDADEFWWHLDRLDDSIDVATARPHTHYGHMRHPGFEIHPKVAFRWQPGCRIDMGNHYVFGSGPREAQGILDVCHYQYRTLEQVRRKVTQGVAAFDLTPLPETSGQHWRDLARLTDDELAAWFDEYTAAATERCVHFA